MAKSIVTETMGFPPLNQVDGSISAGIRRKRLGVYKLMLGLFDFLMSVFGFAMAGLMMQPGLFSAENAGGIVMLVGMALILPAFFPDYGAYSYHVIFFKKTHLKSLCKSFAWIMLSLASITIIYKWPQLFRNYYVLAAIFAAAVTMTVLSRYFWEQIVNVIKSFGIAVLFIGLIGFFLPDKNPLEQINWLLIPLGFLLSVALIISGRYFAIHWIFETWLRRSFRRQIAIIGSNEDSKRIANHIIQNRAPYWVCGVIGECGLDTTVPKNCLGDINSLAGIVEQNHIDEIVVTDGEIDKGLLVSLLDYCTSRRLTVWFPPRLMPIIEMKLNTDNFCGIKMIRLCSQKYTWIFNKLKHSLDALIAIPVCLLLLPLFAVIAVAIKRNSDGPVFYLAKAIGKNGSIFKMFKFRSMRLNNGNEIHKEYVTRLIKGEISNNDKTKQPLKITDDPRITRVGKILRKYSLDELPQIINVLKGDMSLVGPRPCLPYEYEIYKDWHKKRTCVRPGITGLWQVTGRSEVLFEDMILLDLFYIYNRNLLLDFNIIYETVFVVLEKKGAY